MTLYVLFSFTYIETKSLNILDFQFYLRRRKFFVYFYKFKSINHHPGYAVYFR